MTCKDKNTCYDGIVTIRGDSFIHNIDVCSPFGSKDLRTELERLTELYDALPFSDDNKKAFIDTILAAIEACIGEKMTKPPEDCEGKDYALGIMAGYNQAIKEMLERIKGGK